MTPFFKTRIAPTPSGYLHAGNVFNFLLTATLAAKTGAHLLLRIDDLDRQRYRPDYVGDIFETLHFLNIPWQEGPQNSADFEQHWSQQHRMPLYHEALKMLAQKDCVFACTCSRTQLRTCTCRQKKIPLDAPGASWRLHTTGHPIAVQTLDGGVITASLPEEMKNVIVRRKDGVPAYQLASVVDDVHFGIDAVVRGNDLWPSTLVQHYLATQLGAAAFSSIRFHHHPLLHDANGTKLSKSAGALSVRHWRAHGKTAADYIAFVKQWAARQNKLAP